MPSVSIVRSERQPSPSLADFLCYAFVHQVTALIADEIGAAQPARSMSLRGGDRMPLSGTDAVVRLLGEGLNVRLGHLVAERGLAGVTTTEVAEAAGMARTAVHHFVGGRADLVQLALATLVDAYRQRMIAALGPEPDAVALVGSCSATTAWPSRTSSSRGSASRRSTGRRPGSMR